MHDFRLVVIVVSYVAINLLNVHPRFFVPEIRCNKCVNEGNNHYE